MVAREPGSIPGQMSLLLVSMASAIPLAHSHSLTVATTHEKVFEHITRRRCHSIGVSSFQGIYHWL